MAIRLYNLPPPPKLPRSIWSHGTFYMISSVKGILGKISISDSGILGKISISESAFQERVRYFL